MHAFSRSSEAQIFVDKSIRLKVILYFIRYHIVNQLHAMFL